MTNVQALQRALAAIERVYKDTERFDHGGMASHEIMAALRGELRNEFAGKRR